MKCFVHVRRTDNDRTVKRVYVGECAGRPRERWNDIVKDCVKKRGLDVRQTRRMVYDGGL